MANYYWTLVRQVLCALTIFALACVPARAGAERFSFMTIGDVPYTLPADFAAFATTSIAGPVRACANALIALRS